MRKRFLESFAPISGKDEFSHVERRFACLLGMVWDESLLAELRGMAERPGVWGTSAMWSVIPLWAKDQASGDSGAWGYYLLWEVLGKDEA